MEKRGSSVGALLRKGFPKVENDDTTVIINVAALSLLLETILPSFPSRKTDQNVDGEPIMLGSRCQGRDVLFSHLRNKQSVPRLIRKSDHAGPGDEIAYRVDARYLVEFESKKFALT